jgi:hypothetical protein
MKHAVAAACAAGLMLSQPALAAAQPKNDAAFVRDIRCLVIMSQLEVAPEQAEAKQITLNYLMGRMDAESGDTDWTSRVMAEIKSMQGKDLTAETKACGVYVSAKGKALVDRGQRLQEAGKAEQH